MEYEGGIIAYFFVPGDTGYVDGETHGLIAALADERTGTPWVLGNSYVDANEDDANIQRILLGTTSKDIGTGQANTTAIIAQAVADSNTNLSTYAAGICDAYANDGYTDWFLPSKDELNILYLNSVVIGGFTYAVYWSSSEEDNLTVWMQNLLTGSQDEYAKFFANNGNAGIFGYVRPVRAF